MENLPLLHWQYSQEDWNDFIAIEKTNKKEDNIFMAIGILIIGPFALMLYRETTYWIGFLFTLPIAFLIPFLRFKFSYSHLKKNAKNPDLKVFANFLLINNCRIELFNDQRRVKNLKIIDTKNQKKLLEFDVQWTTRKGPTNDEFRFLIPIEKMDEAINFVASFKA